MKQRIDFMVGGIKKSGATPLWKLLKQNPKLVSSGPKEPHFFALHPGGQLSKEQIDAYHSNWLKTGDQFESDKLYFEASSDSLFLHWRGKSLLDPLPLIKSYNPSIKIIILFRDPVERFYSAWRMLRRMSEKGKPYGTELSFLSFFESAFKEWNAVGYQKHLYHGCYASIALRLMKLFGSESLLFLSSGNVNHSLVEIEQFLGLEPFDYQPIGESAARYGIQELPHDCARKLAAFYEPEVKALSVLTGLNVSKWLDGRR